MAELIDATRNVPAYYQLTIQEHCLLKTTLEQAILREPNEETRETLKAMLKAYNDCYSIRFMKKAWDY